MSIIFEQESGVFDRGFFDDCTGGSMKTIILIQHTESEHHVNHHIGGASMSGI